MADEPRSTDSEEAAIDPAQAAFLRQRLASEQNLVLGAAAGIAASLAGAAAWAAITVATGYQIGFMAIGVGFLVGYAVRALGRGITAVFGFVGAALALLGCAVGNLLAVTALVAGNEGVPFLDALSRLDVPMARDLLIAFFSPMDLLFYAIALYEGYRLSFRQVSAEELQRMLSGGARP
jgi:hypothetical protein